MKLLREQALDIVAYSELVKMDNNQRMDILMDLYSENDAYESITDPSSPEYNVSLIEYLKEKYIGVSNEYIGNYLRIFFNCIVEVFGNVEPLETCPCCGYRTLQNRGQYDICKVCFWEDDGSDDLTQYSSVNMMTLEEAKENYNRVGASSPNSISFVDPGGIEKYLK